MPRPTELFGRFMKSEQTFRIAVVDVKHMLRGSDGAPFNPTKAVVTELSPDRRKVVVTGPTTTRSYGVRSATFVFGTAFSTYKYPSAPPWLAEMLSDLMLRRVGARVSYDPAAGTVAPMSESSSTEATEPETTEVPVETPAKEETTVDVPVEDAP